VLTEANSDNEHILIIIDNNTNIPDRIKYIIYNGDNPLGELVRSALRLEFMGVDAIIIACNTAHCSYQVPAMSAIAYAGMNINYENKNKAMK